MKLTDKAIKAARPKEKLYRIFDGEGLYLEITPKGAKYWRMKVYFNGKEDRLALGVYPKISLSEARRKRQDARDALADGKNPRYASGQKHDATFQEVGMEWYNTQESGWSASYAKTVLGRLKMDVFPRIGSMSIKKLDAQDIISVVRSITARGANVKARRVLRYINSIFSFAIVTRGEMRYSPALGLHIIIPSDPVQHNPHLTESELPAFLGRLDGFGGGDITRLALTFTLLTMTRTQEVRFARHSEINKKERLWEIPAGRMKMKRPHLVPLSSQAMAVLEKMEEFGTGGFIFPSLIRTGRPLSENTMLYAIYDMGYKGRLTTHGFRGTASTILHGRGYDDLVIERQLAHVDKNSVRAAYNHAEYINERRAMLQDWADLLDDLRNVPESRRQ